MSVDVILINDDYKHALKIETRDTGIYLSKKGALELKIKLQAALDEINDQERGEDPLF